MSFGHLERQNLSTGGLGAVAGGLRLGGPLGPMEGPLVLWRFFMTDAPMDGQTDGQTDGWIDGWTDINMETFSFYIDIRGLYPRAK